MDILHAKCVLRSPTQLVKDGMRQGHKGNVDRRRTCCKWASMTSPSSMLCCVRASWISKKEGAKHVGDRHQRGFLLREDAGPST